MSAQTASSTAVKVTSAWRGRLAGSFAGAGTSSISFTPASTLLPGEPVQITTTTQATSLGGTPVATAIGYQFRAAVAGGTGMFPAPPDVSLASTPTNLTVADLNADGVPDLLITINSPNNRGTVNVRLSNGQGGFLSGTGTSIPVGNRPVAVAVADLNHDGHSDFLTANRNANTASVRLGDGLGGFLGTTDISVGVEPMQIAVGNFNADNNLDFVTVNGTDNTISLRLGDGLGGFVAPSAPLQPEIPVGITPIDMRIGDVNRDGHIDVVTVNNSNNGNTVTLSVRYGNGQGALTGTANMTMTNDPASMLLTDVTGDGNLDLLMPNVGQYNGRGTVSIRTGNGQGGFSALPEVLVARDPVRLVVSDVNGDGQLDLLTANRNFAQPSGTVSIRLGNGQGGFAGLTDLTVGIGAFALAVADLNRDGRPDLVSTSYIPNAGGSGTSPIASVRLGNGRGSFEGYSEIEVGIGGTSNLSGDASDVVVGDVNSDGHLDMLTANMNASTASVRLGDGRGQFTAGAEVAVGTGPASLAVGDINNDGRLDLLVANAGFINAAGNTVSVRLGNGSGGFSGSLEVPVGSAPLKVAIADINGDGNLDFVTANYSAYSVSVRLGNGQGGFSAVSDVMMRGQVVSVALGDVNGDGKTDLLVADTDAYAIQIRLGNGAGGFVGTNSVSVGIRGGTPLNLALGDVNNDGTLDIVTANFRTQGPTGTVSIRLGNGQGTFTGTTEVTVTLNTQQVALGDINGDGNLDFLASDTDTGGVRVYAGNGAGAFGAGATIPTAAYPGTMALADVDSDGDLDLLAVCFQAGSVSVRLNAGLGTPLAVSPVTYQPANSHLEVFPNPAHASAQLINVPAAESVTLYDTQGRPVRLFSSSAKLDLLGLPKGLYFVRTSTQATRLIIE